MISEILYYYVGLISFIILVNRYFLGKFLIRIKSAVHSDLRACESPIPEVTVVIPCYNEGKGIYDTIKSIISSKYPTTHLKVFVVDDCSKDDSYEWAMRAAEESTQVTVIKNTHNIGKRKGISNVVKITTSQIIVSVDSDVLIDPMAIKILTSSFTENHLAAVGGQVKVLNANVNWLTKMQAIKYYFGYEFLKALEIGQQQVLCLSGCLTAYRRNVLLELDPIIENRNILGVPIKYGEDRYLTRQIVKAGYKTTINQKAFCLTLAPTTLKGYLKQQLRWRRSNYVDFLVGLTQLGKLRPLVLIHYVCLFTLQILYPVVVILQLAYGNFFNMMLMHFGLILGLCIFYLTDFSYNSWKEKINPLWFLTLGMLMPITYLFLSPLALFTLDSGSWETRAKVNK